MAIVQFTRYKSDKAEEVIKAARIAKQIVEKHGAEFYRLSRFHTGALAGEWLVATRYSNWEVYGKVQEALSKDTDFLKLLSHISTIAELTGRNVAASVDL